MTRKIKVALTALALVVVLAVIAAIVFAGPSSEKNTTNDTAESDAAARAALVSQATALAGLDAALTKTTTTYVKIVDDIHVKAKKNEKAVAAWERQWKSRQASYSKQKAAVAAYNANRPLTKSTVEWRLKFNVDPWSGQYTSELVPYTVPGHRAPPKPQPPAPSRPAKVKVRLEGESRRLAKLAKSLKVIESQMSQASVGTELEPTAATLQQALTLLQQRVDEARSALRGGVSSKNDKGEVIAQEQFAIITAAGVAEAVAEVRAALLLAL